MLEKADTRRGATSFSFLMNREDPPCQDSAEQVTMKSTPTHPTRATRSPLPSTHPFPPLAQYHRMPDVLLIGAAKSATTLLTRWIAQHPSIGLCTMREPNFFSHPESWVRGLDWYSELFRQVRPGQLALDSSTGYTQWPQFPLAAPRIGHYTPNAKLIYLMRHPVERAYSHYVHRWTKECHVGEPFRMTFDEYVVEDPLCLDGSDYRAQIEQYLERFPREQLLCLFTFQLERDPLAVLQRICRFLEIDDDPAPFQDPPREANRSQEFLESRVRIEVTDRVKRLPGVTSWLPLVPRPIREAGYQLLRRSRLGRATAQKFDAPPLSSEARQRLLERYAPSNAWVAELTGEDLSCWDA